MKADKEFIEAMRELLNKCEEEKNWLYSVPEKHRKFAAYWDELGRPELEEKWVSTTCMTYFNEIKNNVVDWKADYYRIKDDPHWELRLKWVNSDKTLPIEFLSIKTKKWEIDKELHWFDYYQYREVKPWYEQEISIDKPMLLMWRGDIVSLWVTRPIDYDEHEPLTDDEIDALKRGF